MPESDAIPAQPVPATTPEALGEAPYTPLDPRAVRLWRLTGGIGWGALALGLLVGVVILGLTVPGYWRLLLGSWIILCTGMGAWCLWYPTKAYGAWGYRLGDRLLEIRQGVWFRTLHLLPLPRLQHVDLKRGPIERAFGLSTLVLHTAGTQEPSLEIPCLDEAEAGRLRDWLLAGMGEHDL